MWRKDEARAPSLPAQTKTTPISPSDQATSTASPTDSFLEGRLSRSLVVEGTITGANDLIIDGEVRGKVRLLGSTLTVGPDGRVTADIEAREIFVRGEVTGNIKGHDRVRIAATGKVKGEINTRFISIEEGAQVHGLRVNLEQERRPQQVPVVAASSSLANETQVPLEEKISQVHV
jgi:cytoskeletal protein CcmA (bactofilin family)